MRRRIDTHDLSDDTSRPYCWKNEAPPVLYDEELWQKLQAARAQVHEIEWAVRRALADEPLDSVEQSLCEESCQLMDVSSEPYRSMTSAEFVARCDDIKARALANAATKSKP